MVYKYDFLIIGAGVAGMSYALKVAKAKKGKSSKVKGFIFLILLIIIIFLCSVFFVVISNVLLDVASK